MRTTDQQRIANLTAEGKWGDKTLHGLLAGHASTRPDTLAVKDQPNREALSGDSAQALSWAQLDRASDNLALQLKAAGLQADDRVIVQLPNVVELMVAYYTLSKMGAIMSPVPVQYGSYELQHMREALDAAALITIGRWGKSELAVNARNAVPGLAVLTFGEDLHLDTSEGESFASGIEDDANRIVTICWTSGTTGTPKGVPRSHNMWLATGRSTAKAGDYTPDDILL